jgi:hypothetical protein
MGVCLIERGVDGGLKRVKSPDGGRSELFGRIASIPVLTGVEDAVGLYGASLTEGFGGRFGRWWDVQGAGGVNQQKSTGGDAGVGQNPLSYETGEPRLFFRVGEEVTEDYAEALRGARGRDIEVGFIATEDVLKTESETEAEMAWNDVVSLRKGDAQTIWRLNDQKKFITAGRVKSDSDPKTFGGMINHLIQNNILAGSRVRVQVSERGKTGADLNDIKAGDEAMTEEWRLTGAGRTAQVRTANTIIAHTRMTNRMGDRAVELDRQTGTIRVKNVVPRGTMRLQMKGVAKSGRTEDLKLSDIRRMLLEGRYAELDAKYEGMAQVAAALYVEEQTKDARVRTQEERTADYDKEENRLKLALLDVLEQLGISVMSLSDYMERYKQRYGTDVSAEALADMANSVVALANGEDIEALSEETAHIIVESYVNQDEINEILPDVAETDEYKEQAEKYREIYRKQVYKNGRAVSEEGEAEVERLVRREILGKILAKEYVRRNEATPRTFLQRAREILNRWIEAIRSIVGDKAASRRRVDELVNRLADLTLAREMNKFSSDQIVDNDYVMYRAKDVKREMNTQRYVERLDAAYAMQKRQGVETGAMRAERNRMVDTFIRGEVANGLSMFITTTDAQVRSLEEQVKTARENEQKDPTRGWWTLKSQAQLESANTLLASALSDLRAEINNSKLTEKNGQTDWEGYPLTDKQKREMIDRIDATLNKLQVVNSEAERLKKMDAVGLIDRFCDRYGLPEKAKAWVQKYVGGVARDCWWLTRMFGMLEHTSNPILGMLQRTISELNTAATNNARSATRGLFKWMDDNGINFGHFHQMIKGNYLLSELDDERFASERRDATLLALQAAIKDKDGNLVYEGLTIEQLRKLAAGGSRSLIKGVSESEGRTLHSLLQKSTGLVNKLKLTQEEANAFDEVFNKWLEDNVEREFTDEYYQEREKQYADMALLRPDYEMKDATGAVVFRIAKGTAISEEAKAAVRDLARARAEVINKFKVRDVSGRERVDWSRLMDDDAAVSALNDIAQRRASLKAEYEETGERKSDADLRVAMDVRAMDNYNVMVVEQLRQRGVALADVVEITRRGNDFVIGLRDGRRMTLSTPAREIDAAFFDKVREIQARDGNKAAWEFVEKNGRITLTTPSPTEGVGETENSYRAAVEARLEELIEARDGIEGLRTGRFTRLVPPMGQRGLSVEDENRVRALLDRIDAARERRLEILRQHRHFNDPTETDYGSMNAAAKERVRELTEKMENARDGIFQIVGTIENAWLDGTENEANRAYWDAIADSGESEKDFIEKHLTDKGLQRYKSFRRQMESFMPMFGVRELAFLQRAIEADGFDLSAYEDVDGTFDYQAALDDWQAKHGDYDGLIASYGRSMMLPYFKRFAAEGYDALLKDLQDGRVDVAAMLDELQMAAPQRSARYANMGLSMQNDWYEEDERLERYRNENYDRTHTHGLYQPKLSKYVNTDFLWKFGFGSIEEYRRFVNSDAYRNGDYSAVKSNRTLFEGIEMMKELKRRSLENYGERDLAFHNLYQLPQISKTWTQKTLAGMNILKSPTEEKATTGKTLRASFDDLFATRVDDPLYGQGADMQANSSGSAVDGALSMPKLYLALLEDATDVSTDLGYAYSALTYQSERYKANMEAIGDVMGMAEELKNMTLSGKQGVESNSYKMFKEHADFHFYGKRMNHRLTYNMFGREVDVSKLIHQFTHLIGTINVGFSPIIGLTAAATNAANMAIETAVGQYYSRDSLRRAMVEGKKNAADFWGQYGTRHKWRRLPVMGEHYGIYGFMERARNSAFGKAGKAITRAINPYGIMEILNAPFAPQAMITVLMDTRLVDGKWMNYNQFKHQDGMSEMSSRDVAEEWEKYKEWSLWDASVVDEEKKTGRVEYAERFLEKTTQDAIDTAVAQATAEIRTLNQKWDGTISGENRSTIARSYFFDGLMLHRGWMFQAFGRRWKGQGYNFLTNQMEEGSYRSLGAFLKQLWASDGINGVMTREKWVSAWKEMDDFQRKNFARLGWDFVFMTVLGLMAMALKRWGDDDDNKNAWLVQLISYVGIRTVSEVNNQSDPFLWKSGQEALTQPFVQSRFVNKLVDKNEWDFGEHVSSGRYKGWWKPVKFVVDNTWLRHIMQIKSAADIKKSRTGYIYYNPWTLWMINEKKTKKDDKKKTKKDDKEKSSK